MDQKLIYALPFPLMRKSGRMENGAANGGACGYPGQSLGQAHSTKLVRPLRSPHPVLLAYIHFHPWW